MITSALARLAAPLDPSTQSGIDAFFNSALGGVVKSLAAFIGVAVAIYMIILAVKHFTAGQQGKGFRTIFTGIIFAAITFNLKLILSLIVSVGGLLELVWTSISGIITGGS